MSQIKEILKAHHQEHLLAFERELTDEQLRSLEAQIRAIDWETIARWNHPEEAQKGEICPIEGLRLDEINTRKEEFSRIGTEAIRSGKVAAVLLAGGQGTRLGTDAPKGTYDMGITRPLYIFELLISNLLDVVKACGAYVPLLVMTSEKNDAQTREFLKQHDYFGYPEGEIRFFVQGMAPAVDLNGKLLLEEKGRLALSPNGNGGWYSSIVHAGLLDWLKERGVEWLNVFAVDNVLQRMADPVFVGATIQSGMQCGAKVVSKANPEEKVGVLCLENGRPSVIEYYEISPEMAGLRNERGELTYAYGVILNYLFNLSALENVAGERIPVHVVRKKIPHLNAAGELVKPQTENGYKFETLILDMVRLMGSCLPYEVERKREFAPVKNRTGVDSVDTARVLLEKNGVIL